MSSNVPETICMLPWISIETSPVGTTRPCCLAKYEITWVDDWGVEHKYNLKEHTLEEIAEVLLKADANSTYTRERIRQIEAKALRKMRHPSRSDKLKSFLEED